MNGPFNGLIKASLHPQNMEIIKRVNFRTNAISGEDIQTLQSIGVDCNSVEKSRWTSFKTDLPLCPELYRCFPWDIARAAVIHDQLYACCVKYFRSLDSSKTVHNKAREIPDKVFLLAMNSAEPPIANWKRKQLITL